MIDLKEIAIGETVIAENNTRHLMTVLYRVVGNKRYMSDIENILKNLELTPSEKQSILYLAQDLGRLK